MIKTNKLKKLLKNVNEVFKKYAEDGSIKYYVYEEESEVPEIVVSSKDAAYVWAALDGMVQLWNTMYKTNISFEEEENEETVTCSYIFMED